MNEVDVQQCTPGPAEREQGAETGKPESRASPDPSPGGGPPLPEAGFAPAAPDQLLALLESERRRIAVDLHDGLGPLLTLIKLQVTHAARLLAGRHGSEAAAALALQQAGEHVTRAFDELRRTVMALRPAMVDDLGLLPTLGWLVREFERSDAGIAIDSMFAVDECDIPADLRIVIFRICQEALNNVVKHARASRVTLLLARRGDSLVLRVADDGCGLAETPAVLFRRSGGGLAGIARRTAGSGGAFNVESGPGGGTGITVCWTLPA
jgi:signal transduction histidine kinase